MKQVGRGETEAQVKESKSAPLTTTTARLFHMHLFVRKNGGCDLIYVPDLWPHRPERIVQKLPAQRSILTFLYLLLCLV